MLELFACFVAVVLFAAVWLAVYKLGALDWLSLIHISEPTRPY